MIDLNPAPVPELSKEWIDARRTALVEAIGKGHHHRNAKLVVLGGATVAAAASVAALLLIGGSSQIPPTHVGKTAQGTFLGWSASPTRPAVGQLTAADTSCQMSSVQLPPINKSTDGVSLVPELNDVRGPFTVTVFGNGTQNEALCMTSSGGASAIRWIAISGPAPSPGAITVDQFGSSALNAQPYSLLVGRIGNGVSGVTLALANGDDVTATSGNGFFVAWWPGSQTISSATVTTASGASTQMLNLTEPGDNSTVCLKRSCDQ